MARDESIGLHVRRQHGYEPATVACNRPAQLADEHRRIHALRPHGHDVDDLSSEVAADFDKGTPLSGRTVVTNKTGDAERVLKP